MSVETENEGGNFVLISAPASQHGPYKLDQSNNQICHNFSIVLVAVHKIRNLTYEGSGFWI